MSEVTGSPTALFSIEEVARACGLSRRAIYDAIRRDELEAIRLCSRLRVRPQALELWLAGNTVMPRRGLQQVRPDPSPRPPVTGSFRALLSDDGNEAA